MPYSSAFGHLPFWPRLTVGRMYIYDSTMNRVPASGQIGVNDLASSSTACGKPGSSERIACFDYALASGYALGTIPSFRSARLWDPADVDAKALEDTITRWVDFFKNYRSLFVEGHMIHIQRPDSRHVEATAYTRNTGNVRALLSLFNPSQHVCNVSIPLSLYYAGFAPLDKVTVSILPISLVNVSKAFRGNLVEGHGLVHVVGQEGAGIYEIGVDAKLPPQSYAIYSVSPATR